MEGLGIEFEYWNLFGNWFVEIFLPGTADDTDFSDCLKFKGAAPNGTWLNAISEKYV